jgi:hypothetical protein
MQRQRRRRLRGMNLPMGGMHNNDVVPSTAFGDGCMARLSEGVQVRTYVCMYVCIYKRRQNICTYVRTYISSAIRPCVTPCSAVSRSRQVSQSDHIHRQINPSVVARSFSRRRRTTNDEPRSTIEGVNRIYSTACDSDCYSFSL